MFNTKMARRSWGGLLTWRDSWMTLSLSRQFALMSSVVLLAGMIAIGSWVADKIETSVTFNTAVTTALYMESFIGPHIQELSTQDRLNQDQQDKLDALLQDTSIGNLVASFKVWKQNGLIAYSSRKELIGNVFPPTENLTLAWTGNIIADFDDLEDEEDALERSDNAPYLEIYSPIRGGKNNQTIAVAEFYVKADLFSEVLFQAVLQSWLLVALVTLVMLSLLFTIVHRGSRTIENQRLALRKRVSELSDLRNRLKNASGNTTELNERFLRRVGADLHDGPAQLLGLALLRLDALKSLIPPEGQVSTPRNDDFEVIKNALDNALSDVRNISSGLVLPELDGMSLEDILTKAISMHEYRTNTSVHLKLDQLPVNVDKSIQICLFRMVQEGLNNSARHAPRGPCSVMAKYMNGTIEVVVSDAGPGFDPNDISTITSSGLGLPGLRERIESNGGFFEIHSEINGGTQLVARMLIVDQEVQND